MDIIAGILIVVGLALFETISSLDNAIINAEVLSTMKPKARKWFLSWGFLFAVFIIRGTLPWIIVWAATPQLGPIGSLTAAFSNDPIVLESISKSAPILLVGGGTFLVLLFFHWLFMEEKNYSGRHEKFFEQASGWFYIIILIILFLITWACVLQNPIMALGTLSGAAIFFITQGFKETAEKTEKKLVREKNTDIHKIIYLEILDATFSIDGVLGAFAFTLSVPLILIGNGLGAFVVRHLTVSNIDHIKKYAFLKNGAMYSIFCLGAIMILDSLKIELPSYVSTFVTFAIVGYFFWISNRKKLENVKLG